jgi:hypothetical protein
MLADMIETNDLQQEFLRIRGVTRSKGVLCKTPVAVIAAIQDYYHEESSANPGKHDKARNPNDRTEVRQTHSLYGQLRHHHRKFLRRGQEGQQRVWKWKEDSLAEELVAGQMYAASTMLYRSCDSAFVLVVPVSGGVRKYVPGEDTVIESRQKRSAPRDPQRQRAYQRSLEAIGEDPEYKAASPWVEAETDVVEVYVVEWEDRKKGQFSAQTEDIVVVPVHLLQVKVELTDPQLSNRRVPRKQMRELYERCRVFYVRLAIFATSRPYYIKLGKRESCVCGYHLRWEYLVLGLKVHMYELFKANKIDEEKYDELMVLLSDPSKLRKALVCEREAGCEYSRPACVSGTCSECKLLRLLPPLFDGIKEQAFGDADFDIEELMARDPSLPKGKESSVRPGDEEDEEEDGAITYRRLTRTLQQRKDGTETEQKEFLQKGMPLTDYWSDFKGVWSEFLPHHELAKSAGREFVALKSFDPVTKKAALPRRHVRLVADYLQAHKLKRGRKETQQEFFAQLGMTLLVVSVRCVVLIR